MYWPSNLAESCAHATLPSPVLSRRPSPSHLNIPILPFRFRVKVTTSKARWATNAARLLSIRKMTTDLVLSTDCCSTLPGLDPAERQSAQAIDSARIGAAGAGREIRMISFSASTIRKNTRPPMNSHGQTQSGIASVSKRVWNGGA
jgi:hypothetical protein